jgi:hypothetical protein
MIWVTRETVPFVPGMGTWSGGICEKGAKTEGLVAGSE